MFPVVSAIGGAVGWEVARRAKKAAAKPAEEALMELREREKQLRKELEVSSRKRTQKPFGRSGAAVAPRARSIPFLRLPTSAWAPTARIYNLAHR